jgi:hypothetical protein
MVLSGVLAATLVLASVYGLGIGRAQPFQNHVSLRGFEILTRGTSQEAFLSASLIVNSTSPLKTLHVFLNETDQGIFSYSNELEAYLIIIQTPLHDTVWIADGNTYFMTAVATFGDGSTYVSSTFGWAVYAVQ